MGWNQIDIQKKSKFLSNVEDKSFFYFVHSYYIEPKDKDIILTKTNYGIDFVSAIEKDNVIATQFHIEKSQEEGLKIIKNFGEICACNTSC